MGHSAEQRMQVWHHFSPLKDVDLLWLTFICYLIVFSVCRLGATTNQSSEVCDASLFISGSVMFKQHIKSASYQMIWSTQYPERVKICLSGRGQTHLPDWINLNSRRFVGLKAKWMSKTTFCSAAPWVRLAGHIAAAWLLASSPQRENEPMNWWSVLLFRD